MLAGSINTNARQAMAPTNVKQRRTTRVGADFNSVSTASTVASRDSRHDDARCRVSVLHLLNAVVDSSITSIVTDQIKHFDAQGYDWHIGGLNGVGESEPFTQLGAKVIDFSSSARGPLQLSKAVSAYIRDNQIGIVHTHTPRTTVVASMALGFRRPAKLVTTKHLHAVSKERAAWGWLFTLVDRCAIYLPDQIAAVSNDVGQQILALPGVRSDRVAVIQNAVDIEAYDVPDRCEACRGEFAVPPHATLLGFAGRITKQKRVDLLLEAFAEVLKRYPQSRLLIAGDGEEKDQQQAYARELGLSDRVIWAGHRRDMPRLLAAMDIYVQSSVNEGLSLSLLQAMAARKPVVATDVGGTREVVNERTGILIPSGSAPPIAAAIISLLDHPDRTSRLVENARQLVQANFSVPRQMEKYKSVYEGLRSRDA